MGAGLDTDIAFGLAGDVSTLLVLSGVTTEETLHSPVRAHSLASLEVAENGRRGVALNLGWAQENGVVPELYTDELPDLLGLG